MPRAPRVCAHPGCTTLTVGDSRCHEHKRPSGWSRSPRTASADRTNTAAWKRTRSLVLQRDGHTCQIRGPRCTVTATEVDHVTPVSQGGTDHPSNAISVCHPCHASKTAREASAARKRAG